MNVVELFAGAGGMAVGFRKAGYKHKVLVEVDKDCCKTLEQNGFTNVLCADVREVSFQSLRHKVDVLCGGPPCQPFSIGGDKFGQDDERNMWGECVRVAREMQPKCICFENVSHLCSKKFRPYLLNLTRRFARAGYKVEWYTFDTADYGVPQHRRRCMCIGVRNDLDVHFTFPKAHTKQVMVREAMASLGPPNGKNRHDLRDVQPRQYTGHSGSDLDKPSKTLTTAPRGLGGGQNTFTDTRGRYRHYTIREAARIMTYPDSHKFSETWSKAMTQIGNSVPPLMAKQVALAIKRALLIKKVK